MDRRGSIIQPPCKHIHKTWQINHFEEIGWMDPDVKNLRDYKGRPPMTNHPWTTSAYCESRMNQNSAPWMIYLPSVEIL